MPCCVALLSRRGVCPCGAPPLLSRRGGALNALPPFCPGEGATYRDARPLLSRRGEGNARLMI